MTYLSDKHVNVSKRLHEEGSQFDPLLVNLHDSVIDYKISGNSKDATNNLMISVVNMLDANLTDAQRSIASDVLVSFIKQAEQDIRVSLAEKIAMRNDLHQNLIHFMAYGAIDIAEPILRQSPLLTESDILYIIESTGSDHWAAVANRSDLSAIVSERLVKKGDEQTIINLLNNEDILLDDSLLKLIVPYAQDNQDIAIQYMDYKTMSKELVLDVYWAVSNEIRDKIVNQFKVHKDDIDQALQDSMQDFADTILNTNNMEPSQMMVSVAQYYIEQDLFSGTMLIDCLRRRQGRFFIALMSMMTQLSHNVIWDLMKQEGGQALAVACRATNISKEHFVSIFLLTRSISRASKAVSAEELKMAIRYYDGLTRKTAQTILNGSIAQ